MRRKYIALFISFMFLLFYTTEVKPLSTSIDLKNFYVNNYIETGALNVVTAIYLNYRVFDTIFESLLLLVSVIGTIYFSRHEGDY